MTKYQGFKDLFGDDFLTPNEVLKAFDSDDGIALNKHIAILTEINYKDWYAEKFGDQNMEAWDTYGAWIRKELSNDPA